MRTSAGWLLLVGIFLSLAGCRPARQVGELNLGSPAPPLDVEHWITDAGGRFRPVTQFEPGKVYVVEFWATWCGPCKVSMPHLAELQERYGDEVQIIGISDEDLRTVQQFLASPFDEEQTWGDIAARYTLATDPDESAYRDYMVAAGQQGIPTAFIVGKDQRIWWIGHPMEMDGPLEQIVLAN